MMHWGVWLVALLCLAGCGGGLRFPSEGGATWKVYRAGGVTVRTNVEPEAARKLTETFDRGYQALGAVSFGCAQSKARLPDIQVVMLASHGEFADFAKDDVRGFFREPTPLGAETEALAVFYAKGRGGRVSGRIQQVFQHELAHRLMHVCFSKMPTWLNEGVAEVLETVRVHHGKVQLGRPRYAFGGHFDLVEHDDTMFQIVPRRRMLSVPQLIALDAQDFYAGEPKAVVPRYASAWALTHMLALGAREHRKPFEAYLRQLGLGNATATDAWERSFNVEVVEEDYERYLDAMEFPAFEMPFAPKEHPMSEEAISDAHVRLLLARLLNWSDEQKLARARQWLARAKGSSLELASLDVGRAELELVAGSWERAWTLVKTAFERHPGAPGVAQAVVRLDLSKGRNDPVLVQAVKRLATQPPAVSTDVTLGRYELSRGHAERAIRLLARALDRAPGCWQCVTGLGEAAEQQKNWGAAEALYLQAVRLVPEYASGARRSIRQRLVAVRKRRQDKGLETVAARAPR